MSKKKASSGSTMTLKDFHGGSIPSHLPLPSAPGVVVRHADRPGFDRLSSWGNPMGRPDLRPRPSSSPSTRHLDEKAPFLMHAVHIGRNFDEDERKPLDGGSAPRRMVRDDSFGVPAKTAVVSTTRASAQYGLVSGTANSYSARVSESVSFGARSQNSVGNNVPAVSGSVSTNAWTARKEFGVAAAPPVQSVWSEQDAVSKLVHASALEKVSSGRWQSKPSVGYQRDTESSRYLETENRLPLRGYDENTQTRTDVLGDREYMEAALARQTGRSLNVEDRVRSGKKELQDFERNNTPSSFDVKERKSAGFGGSQPIHLDDKFGGSEMQQTGQSAVSERPKLKLLPRTRPLDSTEPVVDKQGHQQLRDPAPGHSETGNVSHGNAVPLKPALTGTESVNPTVERPKLSLKPRLHPSEQPEGIRERTALFGGARPHELVLKDRGIDHASLINHDQGPHPDGQRFNHSLLRADKIPDQPTSSHLGERSENLLLDQRGGRRTERNHRVETEKVDMRRKNWRNESRKNSQDTERHQQEQPERRPSPETWRKPVEPPKPASPDTGGLRHGKMASALELAQAFSKSHSSDPKAEDRYSGQRGLPGRPQPQVPFSRLTSATPRAQINGY